MEKVVHNIFRVVTFILIALAVVFIVIIWVKGDTVLENDLSLQDKIMNPFLWLTYISLGIALLLAVVFPIFQITQNPKNVGRTLLVIGVLVVIGVIAWFSASNNLDGDVMQKAASKGELTAAGAKRVSAALIGTYILSALAILSVLFSSISSIFKK